MDNKGRKAKKRQAKQHEIDTPRFAAVIALMKMELDNGFSNIVIDKILSQTHLSDRDKGLATSIFYGTLEKKLILDFYITSCLSSPKKSVDEEVRAVLRTAVYQLLFLEKIPDFAAVDEAVRITRLLGKNSAAGFVNGVLRSVIRKKSDIAKAICKKNDLSLIYSVPGKLISLWKKSYGNDSTKLILDSFMKKPKQYIRINSLKTNAGLLKSEQKFGTIREIDWLDNAAEMESNGNVADIPEFKQGFFHVQDLSAQLVCAAANAKKADVVFDLCAAPGGKSFTVAQQMEDKGTLKSFDLYSSRVRLIKSGAKRLGISCIEAGVRDACQEAGEVNTADIVLCDVPCSGFGVIRRKPEIRYKEITKDLPDIQYKILCNGAKIVKPGGRLIYTTCTLNPAENEAVAQRFLAEHSDYEACPITEYDKLRKRDEPLHTMTIMPYAADSDGFFIAVFSKKI